jgi:hypothetical protein
VATDKTETCPACRGALGKAIEREYVHCCGLNVERKCGGMGCVGPESEFEQAWVDCAVCNGAGSVDRITAIGYILEAE